MARTIRCNWNSGRIDRLSWFLEGLYTIPLSSSENTASVDLYLDATTTGLNDTNFVCRATNFEGDTYQEMTTVIIKGIHIQVVYRKTNDRFGNFVPTLFSDMSVSIEVSYRAPPDFDLSPPYYRPASSLTLSCVATGASDSVHIQWGSPHSGSFTNSNSRISPNSIRSSRDRLTVHDAGIHTCTIIDTDGTSLSTRVHVKLYGRLII